MSITLQIPKQRVGNDVHIPVRLTDSAVKIAWATVEDLRVKFYADKQGVIAGDATFVIDPKDNTLLRVTYPAAEPQYLGINKLVLSCSLKGMHKTYDKPVVFFVDSADEEGQVEVQVPDVVLESGDLSSDLICAILNDCMKATEESRQQTADTNRQTADAVQKCTTATNSANDAALLANTAAGVADAATSRADGAAENALQKARMAEQASQAADGAAATADSSAQAAFSAASAATTAKELADTAAMNADTARDLATAAADNANQQANEAIDAAGVATSAADTAKASAATADQSASNANTQASNAKTQADNAAATAAAVEGRLRAAETKVANNTAYFENRQGKVVMVLDDDNMTVQSGTIREDGRVIATYK